MGVMAAASYGPMLGHNLSLNGALGPRLGPGEGVNSLVDLPCNLCVCVCVFACVCLCVCLYVYVCVTWVILAGVHGYKVVA